MPSRFDQIARLTGWLTHAIPRAAGSNRGDDVLAVERAAYAEIGRIVAIPFSVANVYERFADQVAKIIPFDLISITQVDIERRTFTVMYTLGMDIHGLGQSVTMPLADSFVMTQVASSKLPFRIIPQRDGGPVDQAMIEAGLVSRIAAPLVANEKVVGTLHLSSSKPNIYGDAELARLEIVGNQIAGAIASGILLQSERDRAGQLKSLYDVAAIIAQPESFEEKARKIVQELVFMVDADNVVLRRANKEQTDLMLAASAGSGPVEFQKSLSDSKTFEALIKGESILINNLESDSDFLSSLSEQGVCSLYIMPIKSGGRTLGSISVVSMAPNHFNKDSIDLITAFSNELGSLFRLAEQNAQILESQEELESLSKVLAMSNQALESHYLVSNVFSEEGTFSIKAEAALERLITLTGADWATFRLEKPQEPGLHLAAAAGPGVAEHPPVQVLTEAQTISTAAFNEGRVKVTNNYAALPVASQFLVDMGMESMVFLPVRVGERTVGLVTVISKKKHAFDPETVELLTFVVDRLGVVVENSLLHDATQKDHREMEQLAAALSYSNKQIGEWNQQLEERVQIRTQELEATRERAMRSERLAIIGQLSGGIAHDLRNPLGAIKNAAYLAKRKFAADQTPDNKIVITDLLQLIDDQTVRAGDVISNLLSFGSDNELTLSQIKISDVIQDSVSSLVVREDIDLSVNIEPDLPAVLGDETQLIRVLQNLVGNAQDAMDRAGSITIDTRRHDTSIEISVADTGSGINAEDLEKIFEPLYTAKSHGTGLGLAICREVITRHRGTISVDSALDAGTAFTIRIPFAAQDGEEIERSAQA